MTSGNASYGRDYIITLIARLCMASLFLFSSMEKLLDYSGAVGFAAANGIPLARYTMVGAIAIELGGGIALLTARYCRHAAVVLAVWMFAMNLWFHRFWAVPANDWQMMIDNFFHHFVMIGGMMYVFVHGAGKNPADHDPMAM